MEYQKQSTGCIVLAQEPQIRAWFEHVVSEGRKYGLAVNPDGNEKLEIIENQYKDVISLAEGLE